jgi:hypothetical protein
MKMKLRTLSAALGLSGVVALGGAPASAETILACRTPAGILRIADLPAQCKANETPVELAAPSPPSGITRAVHGSVGGDGSIRSDGTGFSSERTGEGNYHVVFDTPFEGTPNCTVTSYLSSCVLRDSVIGGPFKTPEDFRVVCHFPEITGGGSIIALVSRDSPFDFICVE